ncbi:MAG: beta-ketoacyl synthase chain length factor [Pseudomonadota bacterium]|nr:beta-ketoacyl synthase chain length factor [Pseudomonadota bacterium]
MNRLRAHIEGMGYWSPGLPSWADARAFIASGEANTHAPNKPTPRLLAANERRRAPESVAAALDVALAACEMAGRDPSGLSSVFTSTHGDLGITDYMCETLAGPCPCSISPTKFHNSVHNAAAGYWTIGAGCMKPATAISAYQASFAQGLLEALVQLAAGEDAVLLVACDARAQGPLAEVSASTGLLAGALVLAQAGGGRRIEAWLEDGGAEADTGALGVREADNAMRPMLPLFAALASAEAATIKLDAGAGRVLCIRVEPA